MSDRAGAHVGSYGGELVYQRSPFGGVPYTTVQHWSLTVADRFIADTSLEMDRVVFQQICDLWNGALEAGTLPAPSAPRGPRLDLTGRPGG